MASPSKMRAFVQWKQGSVFAGEEIECIISFKNTHDDGSQQTADEQTTSSRQQPAPRQRSATHSTQQLSTAPSVAGSRTVSHSRGHRPALSLSLVPPPTGTHARVPSHAASQVSATNTTATTTRHPPTHGRSLSIMSMGSEKATATTSVTTRRPARAHGRSASMQVLSRTPSYQAPSVAFNSYRNPSPLYDHPPPPLTRRTSGIRTAPGTPAFNFPSSAPPQPPSTTNPSPSRPPSASFMPPPRHPSASASFPPPSFSFPPESPASSRRGTPNLTRSPIPEFQFPSTSPALPQRPHHPPSPKPPDPFSGHANPMARIMSESSANATPRTSSDFYSLTNHSSETVASDVAPPLSGRLLPKPANGRSQQPQPTRLPKSQCTETLMMGYVQTMGSFILDGSLVNQAPFEDVKRKGVVGGQGGGGVVGVERSKRESGMFGGFGWGNIGESLGGLLGGGEMSSIKEMRNVASSKTIPLLSTPQSILFVNMQLAPGETKSYSYRFRLPRGLPPTHKGRAIKVQYHLTIGIQRPGGKQQVKHIEIPFRVLGSVNSKFCQSLPATLFLFFQIKERLWVMT